MATTQDGKGTSTTALTSAQQDAIRRTKKAGRRHHGNRRPSQGDLFTELSQERKAAAGERRFQLALEASRQYVLTNTDPRSLMRRAGIKWLDTLSLNHELEPGRKGCFQEAFHDALAALDKELPLTENLRDKAIEGLWLARNAMKRHFYGNRSKLATA